MVDFLNIIILSMGILDAIQRYVRVARLGQNFFISINTLLVYDFCKILFLILSLANTPMHQSTDSQ